MLTLKKVAVTGGLASGKTTVCNDLKNYGAYVISADEVVHRLLAHDTAVIKKIVADLGPECLKEGKIDTESVAKLVFSYPEKLKILENTLHPAVLNVIEREYEKVKNRKDISFFVAEIPLLFECAWESHFDLVIVVSSSEEVCKMRYDEQGSDYSRRMARQMPLKEKERRADITIKNNGSHEELKKQIKGIIPQLNY